jgi:hypothetical protein
LRTEEAIQCVPRIVLRSRYRQRLAKLSGIQAQQTEIENEHDESIDSERRKGTPDRG